MFWIKIFNMVAKTAFTCHAEHFEGKKAKKNHVPQLFLALGFGVKLFRISD